MTNREMTSLFKNKVVIEVFKPQLAINIKGVDPMSHEKSKIYNTKSLWMNFIFNFLVKCTCIKCSHTNKKNDLRLSSVKALKIRGQLCFNHVFKVRNYEMMNKTEKQLPPTLAQYRLLKTSYVGYCT